MTVKRLLFPAFAASLIAACSGSVEPATELSEQADTVITQATAPNPLLVDVASATYRIEPTHASILWRVSHNGLSYYTARFTDFSADLMFNAENPAQSSLKATINPASVRTDHPDGPDWDTTLATDEKWFHSAAYPTITYSSTDITLTGENTGLVQGELTLLGVTKQVPLTVTFNGARNFPYFGERDVLGFSARATLKRSDFGMSALLPAIGDEVTLTLETEFLQVE